MPSIRNIYKRFFSSEVLGFQYFQLGRSMAVVGISIVLVQVGQSPEKVGEWEWIFFIMAAGSFFWAAALYQHLLYCDKSRLQKTWRSTYTKILTYGALLVGIVFLCGRWIMSSVTDDSVIALQSYALWTYGSLLFFGWCHFKYRLGSHRLVGIVGLLYAVVIVTLFFVFAADHETYLYRSLITGGVVMILVISIGEGFTFDVSSLQFSQEEKQLILYTIIGATPTYFDSSLVKFWYEENADFAVFRLGARELPILMPLLVSFGQAWVSKIKEGQSIPIQQLRNLNYGVGILIIMLMMISTEVYDIIYSSDYRTSVILFDLSLFIVFTRLIFSQTVLYARDAYHTITRIGWIELGVNCLLSVVLIYFMGMLGVVLATVIAFGCEKLLQLSVLKRSGYSPSQIMDKTSWFTMLVLAAIVFLLKHFWL